jgi:rare lipoprotein A
MHTFINNSNSLEIEHSLGEFNESLIKNDIKVVKYDVDDSIIFSKKEGVHSATWYNPHGSRTASGLRFHRDSLTCAYNFSKMHSYLRVTNTITNEFVVVKVTDRMGNKNKNHIDLSKCAFDSIANPKSGRIKVIVEEVVNK